MDGEPEDLALRYHARRRRVVMFLGAVTVGIWLVVVEAVVLAVRASAARGRLAVASAVAAVVVIVVAIAITGVGLQLGRVMKRNDPPQPS